MGLGRENWRVVDIVGWLGWGGDVRIDKTGVGGACWQLIREYIARG